MSREAEPLGAVADGYKPGIPIEELLEALPALDLTGVDLAGVHAHLGRQPPISRVSHVRRQHN